MLRFRRYYYSTNAVRLGGGGCHDAHGMHDSTKGALVVQLVDALLVATKFWLFESASALNSELSPAIPMQLSATTDALCWHDALCA